MFMVRKMAIVSSGDPLCVCGGAACACECVCVLCCEMKGCYEQLSTQRNEAEAVLALSARRKKVRDKIVKVKHLHLSFFFTLYMHTSLHTHTLNQKYKNI